MRGVKSKNSRFLIVAVIILFVAIVAYFFFRRVMDQRRADAIRQVAEGEVSAMFAGEGGDLPDDAIRSRLLRGYVTDFSEKYLTLNTEVSLEDKTRLFPINVTTTALTEYLCWPATVTSEGGPDLALKEMMFSVSDQSKLFLQQQTVITVEEAIAAYQQNPDMYALFALQQPYVANGDNKVFQVALIGCK